MGATQWPEIGPETDLDILIAEARRPRLKDVSSARRFIGMSTRTCRTLRHD